MIDKFTYLDGEYPLLVLNEMPITDFEIGHDLEKRIMTLRRLPPGWCYGDGLPQSSESCETLRRVLKIMKVANCPVPNISPTRDGSLNIWWMNYEYNIYISNNGEELKITDQVRTILNIDHIEQRSEYFLSLLTRVIFM